MKGIVSNATPLIYLAKIGRLSLLKEIYGEVLIPREVKEEVVDRGRELGKKDAYQVEEAIRDGWIRVEDVKTLDIPLELDHGEAAVLSLAKGLSLKEVLFDEVSARTAARLMDLTPRGTVFILLKALETRLITLDEFLAALSDLVQHGFRLREEVYMEAVRRARQIE